VVILGSNKSINNAIGVILYEEFGRVPIQLNPEQKLCQEAIDQIKSSSVAIIDLASINRNSKLFIRQISELCPATRILALHIYKENEFVKPLIDAGAAAYLLVNADHTELVDTLKKLF